MFKVGQKVTAKGTLGNVLGDTGIIREYPVSDPIDFNLYSNLAEVEWEDGTIEIEEVLDLEPVMPQTVADALDAVIEALTKIAPNGRNREIDTIDIWYSHNDGTWKYTK